MRRAVTLTLLCALALLLGTAPAFAHTRLQGSDPADGTSTATPPQRVSLTFNEAMQAGFSTVTLIGPDGAAYQSGGVTADGDTVSIGLAPLGPAGRYEIGYRVVSEDGHPVTGSVAFTLTGPGPAASAAPAAAPAAEPPTTEPPTTQPPTADPPAPAAAQPAAAAPDGSGGGPPVWPWVVGGLVLLVGGVVAALRLGRG